MVTALKAPVFPGPTIFSREWDMESDLEQAPVPRAGLKKQLNSGWNPLLDHIPFLAKYTV